MNACHGASVRREICGAIGDAPGLARWRLSDRRRNAADDAKGPSRAVCEPWAMALAGDRTGQPATDFALALALVLAPLTMSDNARDNAHYTIPGPSLESPDFVGVVRNSGER